MANDPYKINSKKYRAPAVLKAFELLKVVAEAPGELRLSELARTLGFSKSTTHGLIQALLQAEALDYNSKSKKFFIGHTIVDLAINNWNYFRINEQAQPELNGLRDRIDETIFLGALSGSKAIILTSAEAGKPLMISSPPGTAIPGLAGAVGKIFMANSDNDRAMKILNKYGLKHFTPKSITDKDEYLKELERVRKQGYAIDNEEYLPGVNAVAVSLGNHFGLPLAIWVVGFSGSMDHDSMPSIISATIDTADKLKKTINNGRS